MSIKIKKWFLPVLKEWLLGRFWVFQFNIQLDQLVHNFLVNFWPWSMSLRLDQIEEHLLRRFWLVHIEKLEGPFQRILRPLKLLRHCLKEKTFFEKVKLKISKITIFSKIKQKELNFQKNYFYKRNKITVKRTVYWTIKAKKKNKIRQ